MRPTIALLVLHSLVRQFISLAIDIPPTNGVAQTAAPTPQSIHIFRKVEQVRADAANLAEDLECQRTSLLAPVSCDERQSEDRRIVLRRAAAVADFHNALHSAKAIRINAADNRIMVLLYELPFADVIRSAFCPEEIGRASC